MDPEYEARFLAVDVDVVRARLGDLGAVCVIPRILMRRLVFTNNDIQARRGWLRLRDEGVRTSLTYKQATADTATIDSTLEAEVQVSDFDATRTLLEAMGFTAVRYQENYREEWKHEGVSFDLDTWPDLPTFLEIEGLHKRAVRHAAAALGLELEHASYGSVDEVYLAVLDRDILAEPTLTFA